MIRPWIPIRFSTSWIIAVFAAILSFCAIAVFPPAVVVTVLSCTLKACTSFSAPARILSSAFATDVPVATSALSTSLFSTISIPAFLISQIPEHFQHICLLLFDLRNIHIPLPTHKNNLTAGSYIFLAPVSDPNFTLTSASSLPPPRHSSCHINLSRNSGVPGRIGSFSENFFHPANLLLQKSVRSSLTLNSRL